MWSQDIVVTSVNLSGFLKLGQYLKAFVLSVGYVGRGAHCVPNRFLLVSRFYLKFGERFLVCSRTSSVDFRSLMSFIARSFCEL